MVVVLLAATDNAPLEKEASSPLLYTKSTSSCNNIVVVLSGQIVAPLPVNLLMVISTPHAVTEQRRVVNNVNKIFLIMIMVFSYCFVLLLFFFSKRKQDLLC